MVKDDPLRHLLAGAATRAPWADTRPNTPGSVGSQAGCPTAGPPQAPQQSKHLSLDSTQSANRTQNPCEIINRMAACAIGPSGPLNEDAALAFLSHLRQALGPRDELASMLVDQLA